MFHKWFCSAEQNGCQSSRKDIFNQLVQIQIILQKFSKLLANSILNLGWWGGGGAQFSSENTALILWEIIQQLRSYKYMLSQ